MDTGEHDVVVVGGGVAGLAAAIEARSRGASVLLLERESIVGGGAVDSIGAIVASQTPQQSRHGVVDRPEDHWADLRFTSGVRPSANDDALLRVLCDAMPDTVRWLEALGVSLHGPLAEPSQRRARLHVVLPDAAALVARLVDRAHRLGVVVETQRSVAGLVTEADRVVGAALGASGAEELRIARRGVILATGAADGPKLATVVGAATTAIGDGSRITWRFASTARSMRTRAASALAARAWSWVLERGPASLVRSRLLARAPVVAPAMQLLDDGARLVDAHGTRIDDDDLERFAERAPGSDGKAWIVLDGLVASRYAKAPHYAALCSGAGLVVLGSLARTRRDLHRSAPSIAALASRLAMDRDALEVSVHWKRAATLRPPFIALGPLWPVRVHGDRSIAIDASHRALDDQGTAIPGLFAVGIVAGNGLALLGDAERLSWALASGRRAGALAVDQDPARSSLDRSHSS